MASTNPESISTGSAADLAPDSQSSSGDSTAPTSATGTGPGPETPALPPLTPEEFRVYNRLAEQMDYFHKHFMAMWATLYGACTSGRRPANMTLKQFLDEGLRLIRYLESHHTIEESHLYPLLARKMPQFSSSKGGPPPPAMGLKFKKGGGGKESCELLRQHQEIHKGMDVLQEYLLQCKSGETPLELGVLKEKMDLWGDVLMKHLDQEVQELGAEVMRKYWTLAEMKAIPI